MERKPATGPKGYGSYPGTLGYMDYVSVHHIIVRLCLDLEQGWGRQRELPL